MTFAGFPPRVQFTPVPNPIFGPLLEEIDDLGELKCTLRIIWMIHGKKGFPKYVSYSELMADRVLARILTDEDQDPVAMIERNVMRAVNRGTIIARKFGKTSDRIYVLNTQSGRDSLDDISGGGFIEVEDEQPMASSKNEPSNIFTLYEDNIGMLSPMIGEELKEAEKRYPSSWIEEAIREAASNNKRSWRYIAAILNRWEQEGKNDGGSRRYIEKTRYDKFFRR